ncbi:MAG: HAMP domain-containing histidine kinase [Phycisphaerae bacterium]|nr:HAMP domain-containing histidine kinase [Phycisphaerae bacterium]
MEKLTEEQKKRMIEAGQAVLNMSHGVKNILQAVRSAEEIMDIAVNRRDIDQAERTWNILKQNLDRIQKLVLDTLKFSKDEPLNTRPCHLNRLVGSVVETLRPQADQRRIRIDVQTDDPLGQVPMDPEKMRDVVMNLLTNAIEAVDPETGHVHIQTKLDQHSKQAILCIRDNGHGIEDTGIIFEPFRSTKDNVGAGLGLAIAQHVIQKHGGTIEAQSLPGEGAVFTVCIPVNAEEMA